MNRSVRRSSAYAAVGTTAIAAPLLGRAAVVPFLLVAAIGLAIGEGRLFELFARHADRQHGRLRSLVGFGLAATVLAGFATFATMPVAVFAAVVLLVAGGNLGGELVRTTTDYPSTVGFLAGGFVGGAVGYAATTAVAGSVPALGPLLLLVVVGTTLGGLLRSMLFVRDEPPLLLSVGLLLWFLAGVGAGSDPAAVATAIVVMAAFGILSYVLDTASLEGVLAGVTLGIVTIVLGGYDWFALLLAFFAVGGLATKFRYERKLEHGVAEDDGGNRGGINVLANSLVAVAAVLAGAAVDAGITTVAIGTVLLWFGGALATALGDTLSSEIGAAFDGTRLITTLEPVPPGTDGAVTWQGFAAGLGGSLAIGVLGVVLFEDLSAIGGLAVALGGLVGMNVDSLLGATVEGGPLGNAGVNFSATLAGAVAAVALGLGLGMLDLATVVP